MIRRHWKVLGGFESKGYMGGGFTHRHVISNSMSCSKNAFIPLKLARIIAIYSFASSSQYLPL